MLAINDASPLKMENAREIDQSNLLWRSVLAQSVKDIYSYETIGHRHDVIKWLTSADFDTVCDYACVEPTSMRDQMVRLVAMPEALAKKYGKKLRDAIMCGIHTE